MNSLDTLSTFTQIQALMSGRELLEEDWPFSPEDLSDCIGNGAISRVPGLRLSLRKSSCNRCGNSDLELFGFYPCHRCGKRCMYCRGCLMMGVVKSCTALLRWEGLPFQMLPPLDQPICTWDGALTQHQEHAADFVKERLEQKEDGLIWAVCGAGKTEILFKGIEASMQKGERVCIATPRTDVVLELYPRLQQVFPNLVVCPQYGSGPAYDPQSPLVIATTYQLIRFHRAFDVIIIDEVDAFPYSYDPKLAFAVEKALKPHAPKLYLTATPQAAMKKRFLTRQLQGVKIPVRYHGHPLPVPAFRWIGDWKALSHNKKLPRVLIKWLRQKVELNHPVFLFVPQVSMIETLIQQLNRHGFEAAGVHANDPERLEKVKRFREGETPILVTTTILERGVTVSKADVAVIGADDRVFDESSLVQIAGRAGRDRAFPDGGVVFFHYGKTRGMIKARQHIKSMNREGGLT